MSRDSMRGISPLFAAGASSPVRSWIRSIHGPARLLGSSWLEGALPARRRAALSSAASASCSVSDSSRREGRDIEQKLSRVSRGVRVPRAQLGLLPSLRGAAATLSRSRGDAVLAVKVLAAEAHGDGHARELVLGEEGEDRRVDRALEVGAVRGDGDLRAGAREGGDGCRGEAQGSVRWPGGEPLR